VLQRRHSTTRSCGTREPSAATRQRISETAPAARWAMVLGGASDEPVDGT
jgi:hypothetical protein